MTFKPFPTLTLSERDGATEVTLNMIDGADAIYFELTTRNIDGRVHHKSEQMISVRNWETLRQMHHRIGEALAGHDAGERV